jgi:hypothetical protein
MADAPRRRLTLEPGGDDAELGRWLAALEDARRDTLIELTGVTAAMVDWYPDVPLNSISTLLYHIALIEADWVATEILQLSEDQAELAELLPWPDREGTGPGDRQLTRIDQQPLQAHVDRLAAVRAWVLERLRPMGNAEFHRVRELPDYDVAPDWVLHHLLQHEAEHRSHLALLRDMHDQAYGTAVQQG